jgi:succinate dehydrogenase flavin-adding protein (antitoxin of CptAB toxin-antitoxin module)
MWSIIEKRLLKKLNKPEKIQEFIDNIPYNTDTQCRSPRRVIRDRVAHCMEGALFAAAVLRFHGHEPLIADLQAVRDDDHILAVFRENNCFGAVAKSNFTVLRFREPVFRTLRELVMSYFEMYYNSTGEKTLRGYSGLLNLNKFDYLDWMTTEQDLEVIGDYLTGMRHFPILNENMIKSLRKMDKRLYEAGMLGVNPDGLYTI